jgi:Ca-activated chloride channel family protein
VPIEREVESSVQTPGNDALVKLAVERHQPALLRYLQRLLGGDAVRARTVLDAVLADLRKQPPEVEEELMEWVFTRGRKLALAQLGREGVRQQAEGGALEAVPEGEPPQLTLQRLVERLTPKQQEAVRLKFQYGFTYQEIAGITELSVFSVGQLVHNALAHVAREFATLQAGDGPSVPPALDDPRLTAYALGELEPRERKAFESAQLNLKSAAERMTSIRALGTQLTQAMAGEGGSFQASSPRRRRRRGAAWWRKPRTWLAAAGVAVLVATGVAVWRRQSTPTPELPVRHAEDFRLKPAKWNEPGPAAEEQAAASAAGSGAAAPSAGPLKGGARYRPSREAQHIATGSATDLTSVGEPAPAAASSRGSAAPASSGATNYAQTETGPIESAPPAVPPGKSGTLPTAGPAAIPEGVAAPPEPVQTAPGKPTDATDASAAVHPEAVPAPSVASAPKPEGKQAGPAARQVGATSPQKFQSVEKEPRSDLPAEVDASPAVRIQRVLGRGQWPKPSDVRVEAMVNYFSPSPAKPKEPGLFDATLESAEAPWDPTHRLVRVVLQGREIASTPRLPACVVFLVDVSGSMEAPNRLPLVQESLRRLLRRLQPEDRVGIVTYAGESQLTLAPTPVAQGGAILAALSRLQAGGETNGGVGLELAYELAASQADPAGLNAIILCTDGGFNAGSTSTEDLSRIIDRYADAPVTLGVFGFGRGTRIDGRLEALAIRGRGHSGYVNTLRDAEQVLAGQINGLLAPLARDVRVEVEFNPALVRGYRVLGYDGEEPPRADATRGNTGETVLPGHTLTALYEVEPAPAGTPAPPGAGSPMLTLRVGYAYPEGRARQAAEFALVDHGATFAEAGTDFRFAAAVAAFGMALREGPEKGAAALDRIEAWGKEALGDDTGGYRREFLQLVAEARMAANGAGRAQ